MIAFQALNGITISRVLLDNGPAYRSDAWKEVSVQHAIKVKEPEPYRRPQSNGRVELYQRTLRDEWCCGRFWKCRAAR